MKIFWTKKQKQLALYKILCKPKDCLFYSEEYTLWRAMFRRTKYKYDVVSYPSCNLTGSSCHGICKKFKPIR